MTTKTRLGKREIKVLKTADAAGHAVYVSALATVDKLEAKGFVKVTDRWTERWGATMATMRTVGEACIVLTDAGRAALAEV